MKNLHIALCLEFSVYFHIREPLLRQMRLPWPDIGMDLAGGPTPVPQSSAG
jgi:hypothetical protein